MSEKTKSEPIPKVCPCWDYPFCELDDTRTLECDGENYLTCTAFSKWFWERFTKGVNINMSFDRPIDASKKET